MSNTKTIKDKINDRWNDGREFAFTANTNLDSDPMQQHSFICDPAHTASLSKSGISLYVKKGEYREFLYTDILKIFVLAEI